MNSFYGKQCNCVGECRCSKDEDAGTLSLAATAQAERMRVKLMLVKDFQVQSAFINVTKLASILGISPSTIWRQIRNRQFFIPYQIFNCTPMVCIDDLVEWYCSRDCLSALEAAELEEREKDEKEKTNLARKMKDEAMSRARAATIVEDAMAALGLAGNGKRGTGFRPGR
ncbi:helix-turn-helix transcriptional regulator [Janthinobacterium sp. LB3P112]|uniref:helix-turn-helix transcriptional regulator n=1 Tax=Janthinobacterium sp. LB3P112 TaxID=3424196 RepID=UPI003F28EB55